LAFGLAIFALVRFVPHPSRLAAVFFCENVGHFYLRISS